MTANQVTVAAFVLSAAMGGALLWRPGSRAVLLAVPVVCFGRMALNAIDGMLAREFAQKSKLGAVLNELGDVIADAVLYLPLALVTGLDSRLVAGLVILGIIVEMTGVVAVQIGATRNYAGPMGKSDRAFLFGLIALLLGLGVAPGLWCTILLGLGVFLSAATIVNRARHALAEAP